MHGVRKIHLCIEVFHCLACAVCQQLRTSLEEQCCILKQIIVQFSCNQQPLTSPSVTSKSQWIGTYGTQGPEAEEVKSQS